MEKEINVIMSSIYFLLLTYKPHNKKLFTLLDALSPYPIILVDNTPPSDKNVISFAKENTYVFSKNLHLLSQNKNLGYTGGVNTGLGFGYKQGADWIVILNDDLYLKKIDVQKFCKALEKSPKGLAGSYPRFIDPKRWTASIKPLHTDQSSSYLSGSLLALHREVVETYGYLHTPYFIYYEEVEYCVRAKKTFPLTYIPLPHVDHEESLSFGQGSYLHQYYLARNHFLFVERNAPLFVKLYECIRFPKTLYEHIQKKQNGALRGIADYFLRRFGPYEGKYI